MSRLGRVRPKAAAGAVDQRAWAAAGASPSHADTLRTPSSGVSVEPAKPWPPG